MQRYDVITQMQCGDYCGDIRESEDGDLVLYSDAIKEIEKLRSLLRRADDEMYDMTTLDCPSSVERDDELKDEIKAALAGKV
jgi:hypothetical protein